MLRKSIIVAHKSINTIVVIVSLLLFLICLYAMIDAVMVYNGANDSGILKYKPAVGNTEQLRELSDDAVAWITVDGTRIDYPVMQGKTNAEYLNKDGSRNSSETTLPTALLPKSSHNAQTP